MKRTLLFLAALAASPAGAAEIGSQSSVPSLLSFTFHDIGGVKSWRAGGDSVIFIRNVKDQWYRADLADHCMAMDTKQGVRFLVEVDPETNAKVNKVRVDRSICVVTSLKKVDGPVDPPAK